MNEPTTETTPTTGTPLAAEGGRPYTPVHGGQDEAMRSAATEPLAGRRTREPFTRTERMLVTMFVTMFASLVAAGAVGLTSLSGQIADLRSETHRERLAFRRQMHEDIGALREEMQEDFGALRDEMHEEIGGLREEMREEIGGLRSEIGGLSDRIARIETFLQIHHGPLPGS